MENLRIGLLVIVLICQLLIVKCQSNRPKTIAELQAEYLAKEENLWQSIDQVLANHVDESAANAVVDDALKIHRSVFFDNTFETNNYWRSYLLFPIDNFHNYLSNVNETLEENYRYLYNEASEPKYNSSEVASWARDAMFLRLKQSSAGLHSLTVTQNDLVFHHIQNVSETNCAATRVGLGT